MSHSYSPLADVGVVIAAFERLTHTIACIDSLLAGGLEPKQIVVADGGSSKDTIDILQTQFPNIHLIYGLGNLWWAEGMNVGLKQSLSEPYPMILLMNQDCMIDNKTVTMLLAAAELHRDADVFATVVLDKDRPALVLEGGFRWRPHPKLPGIWAMKAIYRPLCQYSEISQEPYPIDIFTAHGVLVRRSVFEKVGLYDEQHFPQRGSDDDLGLRVVEAGLRIIVIPQACSYTGEDDSGVRRGPKGFWKRLNWYMFNIVGGRGLETHWWFSRKHCPAHAIVPTFLYRLINLVRWAWIESR